MCILLPISPDSVFILVLEKPLWGPRAGGLPVHLHNTRCRAVPFEASSVCDWTTSAISMRWPSVRVRLS